VRIKKEILIKIFADVKIGPCIEVINNLSESFLLKIKANGDEAEAILEAGRVVETDNFFPKDAEYDRMIIEIWPKEDDICE